MKASRKSTQNHAITYIHHTQTRTHILSLSHTTHSHTRTHAHSHTRTHAQVQEYAELICVHHPEQIPGYVSLLRESGVENVANGILRISCSSKKIEGGDRVVGQGGGEMIAGSSSSNKNMNSSVIFASDHVWQKLASGDLPTRALIRKYAF